MTGMTGITDLTASFSAEVLKLRKRPAVWTLGALLVAAIVLFRYVIGYAITRQPGGDAGNAQELAALAQSLLVRNVVPATVAMLSSVGGAIALILGALVAGSEYGWQTLKSILTQRPGRLAVLGGKALGLGAVLAAGVLASFAAALASSLVLAGVMDTSVALPGLGELARGVGAAWLILGAWAAVGMALATLFRGTALAIGLGLVYSLVLETIVGGLAGQVNWLATLYKGLPGPNAGALAAAFGPSGAAERAGALVGTTQAGLVLAAYVAASMALAALVLWRRDVA